MTSDVEYDRADLVTVAHELLELIGSWYPGRTGEDTPGHFVWASGYLARCHALLSGVTTLVEHHEDDSVPALYRPLLETYLAGIYVLLGGDEAEAALRAGERHDAHQVERALGRESEKPEGAKKLKVSDYKGGDGLVDRVDDLLKTVDPGSAGWARTAYATQYNTTSYHDTHGGLGAVSGYVSQDENAGASVVLRRGRPAVALRLLDMGLSLLFGFSVSWAARAGKDQGELRVLHGRWRQLDRPEGPARNSQQPEG